VTIVVDASVAIKWILEEEGSLAARRLLGEESLIAPEFLILECANVLWTAARRDKLTRQQAIVALAGLQALPVQFLAIGDYGSMAQVLALELDHPVYDCLYLAVALAQRTILITADRRFITSVGAHGAHSYAVKLLGTE
jgi:predicted nucleic acid-binding protein